MKERLSVTKSTGGDVSVPMTMARESADDTKEGFGSRRWFVTEFQFVTGDSFVISLNI